MTTVLQHAEQQHHHHHHHHASTSSSSIDDTVIPLFNRARITKCEDEPIHVPGAIQNYGCMVVVQEHDDGTLALLQVSENCKSILGYSPHHLLSLSSFYECLDDEEADLLCDNLGYLADSPESLRNYGPHVFRLTGHGENGESWSCWCAAHEMDTDKNKDEDDGFITIILEFESATNNAASLQEGEKQQQQRSASPQTKIPGESSTSTHQLSTGLGQAPYEPTEEQILESTEKTSKPLRALAPRRTQGVKRRRRRGKDTTDDDEDNAETSTSTTALRDQDEKRLKGWSDIGSGISSNIQMGELLGQVNEQLSSQTSLTTLFKTVVGIMLDITSYTRAAVYEFDNSDWSGKVVAELVDIKVTHDLFQGLHFPPGDIPKQARDLYLVNKVRILFDRDSSTSKMLSKPDTIKDKASQVDMTYSFLRAMSPYHIQFIEKIGVRSSMSLSITVDDQLWGMILLHHYGDVGKRVSFPMRMLCLQIGESITRNIERLKRWKQMHLHDFVTSILASSSPREFILEKPDQLVDLFQASYGVLVLDDEERLLGLPELLQESSDASHYIQTQHFVNVVSSNDVYSDLPGLSVGIEPSLTQRGLIIPLSTNGNNFLALFRKAIVNRKTWAGIPTQEDKDKMQIRKSFSAWSDVTISESAEWQQDKRDAASMLKLKLCTD